MKLLLFITLLLLSLTIIITRKHKRIHKFNSKTKLALVEDLARIAHEMAYLDGDKAYTEEQVFTDGGVIGEKDFKCSYGTLTNNPKAAVLVFRGTVAWENLKANLDYGQVKVTEVASKPCSEKCLVHKGFLTAYKSYLREGLRTQFTPFITEKLEAKKIDSLYIIGHSLGGGLATIATHDMGVYFQEKKLPIQMGLVTFGAPRTGNADFKKFIDTQLDLVVNVRVVYDKDPIATVPYGPEYVHCGTEYNFSDTKKFTEKKFNIDETTRNTGFWSLIKTVGQIIANRKDHSQYRNIENNSIVDVVKKNQSAIAHDKTTRGGSNYLKPKFG